MIKLRVLVLSFPDFTDIFSVQRVFWRKCEKVAISRVSVLGGSQNKVGSSKFLFFWLISSQTWLIRLVDDHQNKIEGTNPKLRGKNPRLGCTIWMIKFPMEKGGGGG